MFQETENKAGQVKNATNNPKTGDNILTSVMFFVTSIATIGALTTVKRKKSKTYNQNVIPVGSDIKITVIN